MLSIFLAFGALHFVGLDNFDEPPQIYQKFLKTYYGLPEKNQRKLSPLLHRHWINKK